MNKKLQPKQSNQEFDIQAKLKASNSNLSYLRAVQPHDKDFNYQFNTTLINGTEFSIYERKDDYFILVDFFKSYSEACDHAKKIIDDYPDIKRMVTSI